MNILMNQIHEVFINGDCPVDITLQTIISEDDERPPSTQRTLRCAINNLILPEWFRKA